MTRLRRLLAPFAAAWLFFHAGSVTLLPAALWITSAGAHGTECTCAHDLGAMCPMHQSPNSDVPCSMQAPDTAGAVLTSIIDVTGVVTDRTIVFTPLTAVQSAGIHDGRVAGLRPVPPDPPPPRA